MTRNDGAAWKDVTPKGMPELAYVGCVEISSHDANTVYVSATRYKLADYDPYLFRTKDGGVGAMSDVCPHRGASMSKGVCVFKGTVSCPYHGATFD